MKNIEATKFYVRHREDYPETELFDISRRGLWTLNVETQPYFWVDDIDEMEDLSPTVGIAGYIGDIHRALKKLNKPIPINIDYPHELVDFFGRTIWRTTLGRIRNTLAPTFIKPADEHKLFTGFVWNGDEESRRRVIIVEDEVEVYAATPIKILSEYRTFILDNEILDCRRYKGDYGLAPNKNIIEAAVNKMKNNSPRAYCLDFGITEYDQTVLVEMNEGFSFGTYGLLPDYCARMISARWNEMVK